MTLNPYLNFNGNTEEVFNFYKSVFGGEFAMVLRYGDANGCEDMPKTEKDGIMHIALPVGKNVLMGTDMPESMEQVKMGTNMSIAISVDSTEEADRVFDGLSAGGIVEMPMQDADWGDYFGMLTDKFAIKWLISYDKNNTYAQ